MVAEIAPIAAAAAAAALLVQNESASSRRASEHEIRALLERSHQLSVRGLQQQHPGSGGHSLAAGRDARGLLASICSAHGDSDDAPP